MASLFDKQLKTLEETLLDPKKLYILERYLENQLSDENLKFWIKVNDFEILTNEEEKIITAKKIFDQYINRDSEYCVNIDEPIAKEISDNLEMGVISPVLFDKAKKFVFDLILKGPFRTFLNSQNYAVILHSYGKDALRQMPIALFSKFKQISEIESSWRSLKKKNGVEITYKVNHETISNRHYIRFGVPVDQTPEKVVKRLSKFGNSRKEWDVLFFSATLLEEIPGDIHTDIFYIDYKTTTGKKNLESAVISVSWKQFEDGSIILLIFNVEHDSISLPLDVQRKEEACYYLLPTNEDSCLLYCMTNVDQKGNISSQCIKEEIVNLRIPRIQKLQKTVIKVKKDEDENTSSEKDCTERKIMKSTSAHQVNPANKYNKETARRLSLGAIKHDVNFSYKTEKTEKNPVVKSPRFEFLQKKKTEKRNSKENRRRVTKIPTNPQDSRSHRRRSSSLPELLAIPDVVLGLRGHSEPAVIEQELFEKVSLEEKVRNKYSWKKSKSKSKGSVISAFSEKRRMSKSENSVAQIPLDSHESRGFSSPSHRKVIMWKKKSLYGKMEDETRDKEYPEKEKKKESEKEEFKKDS